MIPVLVGIGAVVGFGLAWLSSEESEAHSDYENSCYQLEKETKQRARDIQRLQGQVKKTKDFFRYLSLYNASVQSGTLASASYDKHNKLMDTIYHKIEYFGKQINTLKVLHDNSSGQQRQQYCQELALMRLHLSQVNDELVLLKNKKAILLNNLREINHQSDTLKLYITKHYGKQVREWHTHLKQQKNT